jgi:hypothetical protein
VIEKQLLEINTELKAISKRIEKTLIAFDKFEETQSTKQKDTRKKSADNAG